MLDIMQFGDESFVVMRVPIKDERGRVIGAAGFMIFDRLQATCSRWCRSSSAWRPSSPTSRSRSPRSGA